MEAVSEMAAGLSGSEIIRLAGEINARKSRGETIHNLTIGDFDPDLYPLPEKLTTLIAQAYREHQTNYPPANGMPALRHALSEFHSHFQQLEYSPEEFIIAGGARPLIYTIFQALVDRNDKVIFPVPSWNNNHYCHLTGAEQLAVSVTAENAFLPVAGDIAPHIRDARMITLCSPLNPTGTIFTEKQLRGICELVLEENKRREGRERPLYLLYDQIYWMLTYNGLRHHDPVSLYPGLRPYTIYVDGLSKAFAATGVRVGWTFGPPAVIEKMKSILGHIGAWAPKAEQVACGEFLKDHENVKAWITHFRSRLQRTLHGFYESFISMKNDGLPVDAIPPAGAIYLTVKINGEGMMTNSGNLLRTPADTTAYLLEEAGTALVPFHAFGADTASPWYRLSVGTVKEEEVKVITGKIREALTKLKSSN